MITAERIFIFKADVVRVKTASIPGVFIMLYNYFSIKVIHFSSQSGKDFLYFFDSFNERINLIFCGVNIETGTSSGRQVVPVM